LTVESRSGPGTPAAAGLSAVGDNLIVLRHADDGDALQTRLTLIKTRGSGSVRVTQLMHLGNGGARLESRAARNVPPSKHKPPTRTRSKRRARRS
jgi:hypothetical protein